VVAAKIIEKGKMGKQVIRNQFQILSKKAEIFKILRILVFFKKQCYKN
jgi:hypothetical protein